MTLCACGCDEVLPKARFPSKQRQFINGHQNRGRHRTPEMILKISGSNNYSWKGDEVGNDALHEWLIKNMVKPDSCPRCIRKIKLHLCNVSPRYDKRTYTRDFKNWLWLCARCHLEYDGRINYLEIGRRMHHSRSKKKESAFFIPEVR